MEKVNVLELRVERQIFTPLSTIGDLTIEGVHECWTLEPVWTEENVKPRAIPEGRFRAEKRWSEKHQRDLPMLVNVPDFSDVEIHIGNFPINTEGCTLVGSTKGPQPDFIGGSKQAFGALWEKLCAAWDQKKLVFITYVNKGRDDEPTDQSSC